MSDTVVFLGPTLTVAEARQHLDATYLGPVAQGDVAAAAMSRPFAIGIVDGLFERVPSVWHKEILWAITQGIHVFGSSSLGALRAAELHRFGMRGVGQIFAAFADGSYTDDDEVAVTHAPAGEGWVPISEAMVNIRATVSAAAAEGVISERTRCELVKVAKSLFYADRFWPSLLTAGLESGLPAPEVDALAGWLPRGRVDQKRLDAVNLLQVLAHLGRQRLAPQPPNFHLERTLAWEEVAKQAAGRPGATLASHDQVLDELRLSPHDFERVRDRALARLLADGVSGRGGEDVEGPALQQAVERFRRQRGLVSADDLAAWLVENDLDEEQFFELVRSAARKEMTLRFRRLELPHALVNELKLDGSYAQYASAAVEKQEMLDRHGLAEPDLRGAGASEPELFRWWFAQAGNPGDGAEMRLAAYRLALEDEHALRRLLLRELCARRLRGEGVGIRAAGSRGDRSLL